MENEKWKMIFGTNAAKQQPYSHPSVVWTAAALGRYPIDNLIGIHDVAGLAVDAV